MHSNSRSMQELNPTCFSGQWLTIDLKLLQWKQDCYARISTTRSPYVKFFLWESPSKRAIRFFFHFSPSKSPGRHVLRVCEVRKKIGEPFSRKSTLKALYVCWECYFFFCATDPVPYLMLWGPTLSWRNKLYVWLMFSTVSYSPLYILVCHI